MSGPPVGWSPVVLASGRTDPASRAVVIPTETDPDPVSAEVTPVVSGPEKPKRTAPVEVWRASAEAQGLDIKGLSKKDIIAAVR